MLKRSFKKSNLYTMDQFADCVRNSSVISEEILSEDTEFFEFNDYLAQFYDIKCLDGLKIRDYHSFEFEKDDEGKTSILRSIGHQKMMDVKELSFLYFRTS